MSDNKRSHYRIVYTQGRQPIFECAQGKFNVLDISEGGLRVVIPRGDVPRFTEDDEVEGKLSFPEKRGSVQVKGVVLRVRLREVAVTLATGGQIPLTKIVEEQRVLIQKGRLPTPFR